MTDLIDFAERRGAKRGDLLSSYSRVPSYAPQARLRAETYRVLIALGTFADDAGRCWPGLPLLAKKSGVIRHNLHRNIRDLVDAGLLRVNPDGSYRLLFGRVSPQPERVSPEPERVSPEPERVSPEPERVSPEPERVSPEPPYIEEQPIEQTNEHTLGVPPSDACVDIADLFYQFWEVYPHRPGDPKRVARKAFAEVVNAGVAASHLIERAREYACETADHEPRYRTHAVRWLQEQCWATPRENGQSGSVTARALSRIVLRGDQMPGEARPKPPPIVSEMVWRQMLTEFAGTNGLASTWRKLFPGRGLPPQNNATRVPMNLRIEFGYAN